MIPGFENTEKQLDALTVRGDLISRKAAIEAINKDMYADKDYMSAIICEGIENVLNSLPTAEPEPKRGKWIKHKDRSCWYCSECNADDYYAYSWDCDTGEYNFQDNYCPNCGAKMKGESDE